MSRRHAILQAVRPVDPRSRAVSSAELQRGSWVLTLECGHVQRRRTMCVPLAAICTDCPPAGGQGGKLFYRSGR